jgi:predicted small lipoprotein YifL
MRNEFIHGGRTVLCLVWLMTLAACGQTGALFLPGTEPLAEPSVTQTSDDDDQEEDEVRR